MSISTKNIETIQTVGTVETSVPDNLELHQPSEIEDTVGVVIPDNLEEQQLAEI